jgi:hypothetical protein
LYSSSRENQAFLHARLGLGADVLGPYKKTIARWMWPDISRGQDTSVSKAKKAIADYKKAVGRPEDLAELMTYYCEQDTGFGSDVGFDDEGFFVSVLGMLEAALKLIITLDPVPRERFLRRLGAVSSTSRNYSYGMIDEIDDLLGEHLIQQT